MMLTLVGIILLISPFLLISKFKDKKLGFIYVLFFVIAFHLFIAIITQLFHVFNYSVVLSINAIVFLIVAAKINWPEFFRDLKLSLKKIDWVLAAVIIISFFCLYAVHYNYSGKYMIFTAAPERAIIEVNNISYPYPYYADEWYAINLIKNSIKLHSLPINNPFSPENESFINFELPFHSFLSEIVLLLKLDPLTQYTILALFFGLLTVVLVYLFLLFNNIERLTASIASLSVLYITNGSNLPGIWDLIPINLGIIAILLGFIFISIKKWRMVFFAGLITLIFYPPLFVFYTPVLLVLIFRSKELNYREKLRYLLYYFFYVVVAGAIISAFYFIAKGQPADFFNHVFFKKIYYSSFTVDFLQKYVIYNVIPFPILLLAIFGIIYLFKKRSWFLVVIAVGTTYWLLYSFFMFRFIIEYERIVFIVSLFITIVSGFGLHYFFKFLKKLSFFQESNINIIDYACVGLLVLFLIFSVNYTKRGNWQELKSVFEDGKIFSPAAPANRYLHPDDLKLFKDINNKIFLSFPWKGTVIGVATNNYSLITKGGTITNGSKLFSKFINSDCDVKNELAIAKNINYVYFSKFECPNFDLVGVSSEKLYLYKFSGSAQ